MKRVVLWGTKVGSGIACLKAVAGALRDYDSSPEKYIKNLKLDETKLISPKRGFGSSLRELRNGESISDRTVKAQKELVYQHELLSQIKEKERLKLSEEKIKDETKLRELDEYLNTYYKGRDNVPSHMRKYMRKKERHVRRKYDKLNNKDDCDDFDVETPPTVDSQRFHLSAQRIASGNFFCNLRRQP